MKLIYENHEYKAYDVKIEGYNCQIFETPERKYSVKVPLGETEEDKLMFDKLVYYNQMVYHADTAEKVIKQVRNFIKNYKKI